jgi:hypothetical protein
MTSPEDYIEPELTPAQLEVKSLADEILSHKPENFDLTFWNYATDIDPHEVEMKLRQIAAGSLLLGEGESLSAPNTDRYWPELDLFATKATLKAVSLRAWGWEWEKHRRDPSGPTTPPFDIISFPGEKDWARQLDISLHYDNGRNTASQAITTYTASERAGITPTLSRDVHAMAYAETGYEGHNQKFLEIVGEEDVLAFTGICRHLFEHPA